MSFHIKVLTLVDRSHLFLIAAVQILLLEGHEPSRLEVVSLVRSRFVVVFLLGDGRLGWDLWMRE